MSQVHKLQYQNQVKNEMERHRQQLGIFPGEYMQMLHQIFSTDDQENSRSL
jgi:hypothetical protein